MYDEQKISNNVVFICKKKIIIEKYLNNTCMLYVYIFSHYPQIIVAWNCVKIKCSSCFKVAQSVKRHSFVFLSVKCWNY